MVVITQTWVDPTFASFILDRQPFVRVSTLLLKVEVAIEIRVQSSRSGIEQALLVLERLAVRS